MVIRAHNGQRIKFIIFKPYLGLVSFRPRHYPAENLHFLRHHRSLLFIWGGHNLRQWSCCIMVVLCSDEEGGDEETKHEANTWTVDCQIISGEERTDWPTDITRDLLTPILTDFSKLRKTSYVQICTGRIYLKTKRWRYILIYIYMLRVHAWSVK